MTTQRSSREDSRTASRFIQEERTQFAAIWHIPGDERLVEVFDESLHGLCLVSDDPELRELGREWHIAYAGAFSLATVRHAELQPDGRYHIGLECRGIGPEFGHVR